MNPNPIAEALPLHYDGPAPEGTQGAWFATVNLLIPRFDQNGTPVNTHEAACDYVAETLRGQFLDWAYEVLPETMTVSDPYVEGQFI